MKISELGQHSKQLITKLPVDNDQYDLVEPGNRIDGEEEPVQDTVPDNDEIDRLRHLAGLTLGTGNKKGDIDSPFTHGGSDKGEYMKKNKIEPGTEAWFRLWFARPETGENPFGPQ
jgi:hypothetical protein